MLKRKPKNTNLQITDFQAADTPVYTGSSPVDVVTIPSESGIGQASPGGATRPLEGCEGGAAVPRPGPNAPDDLTVGAICLHEPILAGARVIMVRGFVYELRAFAAGKYGTVSGYFDDAEKLAKAAVEMDNERWPGIYVTLNPVVPSLLREAANCVRCNVARGETTSDGQILCRLRLLVDIDPVRESGCSTDAEKAAALRAATEAREKLRKHIQEKPVLCDSGNGFHLIYPLALPNNDDSKDLVARALQTISRECQVPGVKVDTAVGNAGRITRLYGTMNCKGESTADRPHRRSGVIQ